ncbi:MAG TPA: pseudouridine synthase, partial [Verrucomicrobiae bacterium]|nr:pseudouridine synthase [Verrucomicrobiae bacterium]
MAVRLQKYLAEAGVASRRACEQYITAGRVCVNNDVVSALGVKVEPGRDRVTVDGRSVAPRRKRYVALNKPRGVMCTREDEEARDKIGDLLPADWTDLFSVGRLDCNSEGLIFLTNDGDFCLKMTHPRYGMTKTYVAKIQGKVTPEMLKSFTQGIVCEGEKLRARRARLVSSGKSSSTV